MNHTLRVGVVLAVAMLTAGCGDDPPETPTTPTPTPTGSVTQHFVGTLSRGGSRFYSFTVGTEGNVVVMLASITSPRTGAAIDVPLGLGLGRPQGEGCALSTSLTTGSGLTSQIQANAVAGIHCISVYDVGALTGDVNFAVRYIHQ